jgi:hypothetical protein
MLDSIANLLSGAGQFALAENGIEFIEVDFINVRAKTLLWDERKKGISTL